MGSNGSSSTEHHHEGAGSGPVSGLSALSSSKKYRKLADVQLFREERGNNSREESRRQSVAGVGMGRR